MRAYNRREAAALAMGGLFGLAIESRRARAAIPTEITEVAPGLFVRTGAVEIGTASNKDAIANIGFAIGRDAVAVIDPGGSLADGIFLREAIRARTALPIRYVIVSHIHPDHILGCPAFAADHPVYIGHVNLPRAIAERGEFYRAGMHELLGDDGGAAIMPDQTVSAATTIDLGGRALEIRAHGPAHSGSDLTVMDNATGTLWAADLLFVNRMPSLDGSVRGWLKELAILEQTKAARAVPGHGPASVSWPESTSDVKRYLRTLADDVRQIIKRGGDIEEAGETAGQSERDRWKLFDDYNGHNAVHAFHELEWENAQ